MSTNNNIISPTDVNKLRHALEEAGYMTDITNRDNINSILQNGGPIVPILKNLLSDLQSTSRSNNDLMKYYDELYDKWKEASSGGANANGSTHQPTSNPPIRLDNIENDPFDLSALLDSSLLSNFSLTSLHNEMGKKEDQTYFMDDNIDVGDSFILSSVEKAQDRIAFLEKELANFKATSPPSHGTISTSSTKNEISLRAALKAKQEECERLRSNLHDQQSKMDSVNRTLLKKNDDLSSNILKKLESLTSILPVPTQQSILLKGESLTILLKGGNGAEGLLDFIDHLSSSLKERQEYLLKLSSNKDLTLKKREKELEEVSLTLNQYKQGNIAFQSQISNLTKRINHSEWESNVQMDLSSQIGILRETLTSLEERSQCLDRIQGDLLNSASSIVMADGAPSSSATLQSLRVMLEAMSTQLHTDLSFGIHLTNVVEKLNIRRSESESEIHQLQEKLCSLTQKEYDIQSSLLTSSLKMEGMEEKVAQVEREEKILLSTIESLKDNVKMTLRNLDLLKKSSIESKQAKDSYEAVISGMKRNEEMIKGHVKGQDEEITRLREALSSLSNTNSGSSGGGGGNPTSPQLTQLIKDEASLSSLLKQKEAALERAEREIIDVREEAKAAKEILDGRKKERDLLMTTYCKVIKDNERLTFELEEIRSLNSLKNGPSQESTIRAFDQRLKIQSEDMEALRMRVGRAESHARAEEAKSRLLREQLSKWEDEAFQKEKELLGAKGRFSSLEQNKRDLAAQLQRFSSQAKDLRDEVRRVEGERAILEKKLLSSEGQQQQQHPSSLSSSSSSGNEVRLLSNELSKTKNRISSLLKDKEDLNTILKNNSDQLEFLKEQIRIERKKREDGEAILRDVKGAGGELKNQLNLLSKEHDLERVKRRIGNVRRIGADETVLSSDFDIDHGHGSVDDHSVNNNNNNNIDDDGDYHNNNTNEQQSFSNVPGQAWRSLRRLFRNDAAPPVRENSSHRNYVSNPPDNNDLLRMENRKLREDLMGIRDEIKDNLSSDIANSHFADLDTSITEIDDLLSAESVEDSLGDDEDDVGGGGGVGGGGLDRVSLIKRRLERENRALMTIVDRVRGDLLNNKQK